MYTPKSDSLAAKILFIGWVKLGPESVGMSVVCCRHDLVQHLGGLHVPVVISALEDVE